MKYSVLLLISVTLSLAACGNGDLSGNEMQGKYNPKNLRVSKDMQIMKTVLDERAAYTTELDRIERQKFKANPLSYGKQYLKISFFEQQYLYCGSSHWVIDNQNGKAISRQEYKNGRKTPIIGRLRPTYDTIIKRCDTVALQFSNCLLAKGIKLSPSKIKKTRKFYNWYFYHDDDLSHNMAVGLMSVDPLVLQDGKTIICKVGEK